MTLRSFLTRLVWICVFPLLLLAVWLAVDHVAATHADLDRDAERIAKNAANAIDHELTQRIGALQVLAHSPLADEPREWPALYREALAFRAHFDSHVMLVDSLRQMRLHTAVPFDAALPPLPHPDGTPALLSALENRRPGVGDLFQDPIGGGWVVALAVPAVRADRVAFVVLNTADARQFEHRLDTMDVPTGWAIALLDSRGVPIARRGAPASSDTQQVVVRTTVAPWTVRLELPNAHHRAGMRRGAIEMALALAGVTLVSVAGATWASRHLTSDLRALTAPAGVPSASAIREFAAVRRLIDEAGAVRERALVAQHEAERAYRADLEAKSIELAVRESQLRGILDSAIDAIITTGEDQTIVMANPAAARMFRCSVAEMIGTPIDRLVPERYRARHQGLVNAFGQSNTVARHMSESRDIRGRRCDGEEFPIDAAISQAHVDGHRLYTVILRDITERRRAERELGESRATLEAALASMSEAVLITDANGGIVHSNAAYARFHRQPDVAHALVGLQQYATLIDVRSTTGAPLPQDEWPVPRALRGESGAGVEYLLRRQDTGENWVGSFSFAPIRDGEGRIVGTVVAGRDVTEIRRVRAELEVSHADLQRLIAAKDSIQEDERKRIARELHDDLQQTLAAALMEVSAARRGAVSAAQTGALDHIDELIAQAIVSSRRIVNDLRPQMLEELGLLPALEALGDGFSAWSGVACEVDAGGFDADSGPIPQPTATCLYRVAQESLNNVAKHAGASLVRVRIAGRAGARLRLTIQDDGKGMAEEDRRKPESFGLLGMGERVRAIGGTVRMQGAPGTGTRVEADVPWPAPPTPAE